MEIAFVLFIVVVVAVVVIGVPIQVYRNRRKPPVE